MSVPAQENSARHDEAHAPDPDEVDSSLNEELAEHGGHAGVWRAWLYSLAALGVIFFGTGRYLWSLGTAALVVSGVVLLAPPRSRLPRWPAFLLVLLALVPGLTLLPASWFGGVEEWRQRLIEVWALALDSTVTPQVSSTMEGWMIQVLGVFWLWAALGQNFGEEGRRVVLRVFALGGVALAAVSLGEFWTGRTVPFWPREGLSFGPFANPNHSSSLFAFTAVLCAAAAQDAYRRGSAWSWGFIVGGLVPLVALMVNSSRAGLLLFFLGFSAWLAISAMRQGLFRRMAVVIALVLMIVSVTLAVGGRVGLRLRSMSISEMVSSDFRWWIAGETLQASQNSPWLGHGLGTFATVFPLVNSSPLPDTRPRHPESDVLWLLYEGGLLSVLPCVLLVVWWVKASGPWGNRGRKRRRGRTVLLLRRAAFIAVLVALLHAWVDVPLHSLGYFMAVAVLMGQSLGSRGMPPATGWLQPTLFRVSALLLAPAGLAWLAVSNGHILMPDGRPIPLPGTAVALHDGAVELSRSGRRVEAARRLAQAMEVTPMDFRLYFLRAQLILLSRGSQDQAMLDFGRVRALEPRHAGICQEEGLYWLHFAPQMAMVPWRECLRRYPPGNANIVPVYQQMVIAAAPYPEIMPGMWKLADSLSLQMIFFSQVRDAEAWRECMSDFLGKHPGFADLDDGHVRQLLRLWEAKGGREELMALLAAHPRLHTLGWRVLAAQAAQEGRFKDAFQLASRHVPLPQRPSDLDARDIPALERAAVFNSSDPRPHVELFYARLRAGQLVAASSALDKALSLPGAPAYLKRERAELLARQGEYHEAWLLLEPLMQALVDDKS